MPRPNITIIVDDQSFVAAPQEGSSSTVGGIVSFNGLIPALGLTAERERGIMTIESVGDWVSRLRSNDPSSDSAAFIRADGTEGSVGSEPPYTAAGITYSRFMFGPTGAWKGEWWSVHNFLKYGGVCIIGGTGSVDNTNITYSSTPLHDRQLNLDVVFVGDTPSTETDVLSGPSWAGIKAAADIATTRRDCIGIIPQGATQGTGSLTFSTVYGYTDFAGPYSLNGYGPDAPSVNGEQEITISADEHLFVVFGNKRHFDLNRNELVTYSNLQKTNCSADVAGCFARTDRTKAPWWSPAGFERGQILDVLRLENVPTELQQDNMYDNNVNTIVTFPGEGTVLFGDKTTKDETSTFSRVNVVRLFIYLKKIIGKSARKYLFEVNDSTTRLSFVNGVSPFLDDIVARRGLYEYKVVCDETNNPAHIIDANQFVADVFLKPTKSINFIKLTFTNKNTGDIL